jgi:hypothetical protein
VSFVSVGCFLGSSSAVSFRVGFAVLIAVLQIVNLFVAINLGSHYHWNPFPINQIAQLTPTCWLARA